MYIKHSHSNNFHENPASQTSVIALPNIVFFSDPASCTQTMVTPASRIAVKSRIPNPALYPGNTSLDPGKSIWVCFSLTTVVFAEKQSLGQFKFSEWNI